MERFFHPENLWWLGSLVVLVGLFVYYQWKRNRNWEALGNPQTLQKIAPNHRKSRNWQSFGWFMIAVSACVLALAQPQGGARTEMLKREQSDVFIAFDVSNSMLAEDLQPNRLERARLFASKLISQLKGDRIGLIFFAGTAQMQIPLTTDYNAAQVMLKTASPEVIASQGTAIGEAVTLANDAFNRDLKDQKALIIITDGEDHEPAAEEAVRLAEEQGITTFTVGVGSTDGAPVPVYINGRKAYKRDRTGATVMSKLNASMLQSLADAGGGEYLAYNGGDDAINVLLNRLALLEKQAYESIRITEYEDYFQWFLIVGFLALLWEEFKQVWRLKNKIDNA